MRSIEESQKEPLLKNMWENYKKLFKLNWVFTSWYEKIILFGCILWAMYSIGRWIL